MLYFKINRKYHWIVTDVLQTPVHVYDIGFKHNNIVWSLFILSHKTKAYQCIISHIFLTNLLTVREQPFDFDSMDCGSESFL